MSKEQKGKLIHWLVTVTVGLASGVAAGGGSLVAFTSNSSAASPSQEQVCDPKVPERITRLEVLQEVTSERLKSIDESLKAIVKELGGR